MKIKANSPLKEAWADVSERIRTAQPGRRSFLKVPSPLRVASAPQRCEKIRGSLGGATSLQLVPPFARREWRLEKPSRGVPPDRPMPSFGRVYPPQVPSRPRGDT